MGPVFGIAESGVVHDVRGDVQQNALDDPAEEIARTRVHRIRGRARSNLRQHFLAIGLWFGLPVDGVVGIRLPEFVDGSQD